VLRAAVQAGRRARAQAGPDVELLSVISATPKHRIGQQELAERAGGVFPQFARLEGVYANSGVETRYYCEPRDWYYEPHGWEERSRSFQRHARELIDEVARKAVAAAGIGLGDIDVVITNTSSALAVPSLDADLLNRLDLPESVERVPMVGLGCGGGVAALARGARLAQAIPGAHILCLVVDLNTLHFRVNDPRQVNFISGAIFGDGAAGLVLRSSGGAAPDSAPLARIQAVGEHFWRKTETMAGLYVKDDGLSLMLSPDLPGFVQKQFGPAVTRFLERHGWSIQDFEGFLLHPGSSKLLESMQEALGIDRRQVHHSWKVLNEYSNMSSPTVLFVLESAVRARCRGRYLLCSLGPGLSAFFAVADL
jgi:alkylresorcinol/alkylpyrone synthase